MRYLHGGLMAAGVVVLLSGPASAQVVVDTQFSAAEGYVNGPLGPHPDPNDPNVILPGQLDWGGQPFTLVDLSVGKNGDGGLVGDPVNFVGWVRNAYSRGFNGSTNFDPSTATRSFMPGDQIKITFDYQFTLSQMSIPNVPPDDPLYNGGLPEKDNFMAHVGWRGTGPSAANNFETEPDQGIGFTFEFGDINPDRGGRFEIFPDREDANFWNNGGNDSDPTVTGVVLDGIDIGLNPAADPNLDGGNGLGVADFTSDWLRFEHTTTYLGDNVPGFEGFSLWQVEGSLFKFTNLDTGQTWNYTGSDTELLQIWATPNNDAFPAFYTRHNQYTDFSYVIDAVKYELCPLGVCASPTLDGDLDGDGFVGIADLNIVLGNWNQNVTAGDLLAGDPSGDGFVGIEDLNTVLGNWNAGTPPSGSAVPEPATLALLGLGGVAALRRR